MSLSPLWSGVEWSGGRGMLHVKSHRGLHLSGAKKDNHVNSLSNFLWRWGARQPGL